MVWASAGAEPKTVLIDTTCLKAQRAASGLIGRTKGVPLPASSHALTSRSMILFWL